MKRGNFDKPRILRYGFLKAHEEHHDDKGHKTLICYDNQEHCFVRLKHDFVSNHGISYAMGVAMLAPTINSITSWSDNCYITFHWWMYLIALIAGLIGSEANRRNDFTQFEKIEQTEEIVNTNLKYWMIYVFGIIPIDMLLLYIIYWARYPQVRLSDAALIFAMMYLNVGCICVLLEGLYVRIHYVR